MLLKLIRTGVLGFFVLLSPMAEAGRELCPKLGQAGLAKLARERGPLKLVFFASWCGECLGHLRSAQGKNTLLIATFDEKTAAERIIGKLVPKSECYFDDGLASSFKVEAVPTTVDFKG